MNELKKKLIEYLLSEKFFDRKKLNLEDFEQKFKDIINLITINAPIKIIYKNKSETEIILMFNEIRNEIEKIELRKKVEFLEDKVSINLDEALYSELLSLRNQLKGDKLTLDFIYLIIIYESSISLLKVKIQWKE